jgi:hypothetical protein
MTMAVAIFLGRRWELRPPYLYSYGALMPYPPEVPAAFRAPHSVPAALIEACLVTMMLARVDLDNFTILTCARRVLYACMYKV